MSQAPKISVIIPAYNAGDTLHASLESVFAQTMQDFEIIVVDDASDQPVQTVLKNITDPRLTIVTHDTNRCAAAARNTGIDQARGDYVAFLDSDDIWLPHKLECQFSYMENSAGPGVQASCTGFLLTARSGHTYRRSLSPKRNWNKALLFGCNVSPGSTMMARRDLFDETKIGPFSTELRRLEDWDWLLSYIANYKLGVVPDFLCEVRTTGYPDYAVVKAAADKMERSRRHFILEHFGALSFAYFRGGLQIEKAGAAFRLKKYVTAFRHIFICAFISPRHIFIFCRRLIRNAQDLLKNHSTL